jgi:ABC-type multidrug transport system permease subunit
MKGGIAMGAARHFLLTLRLNFRSRQALAYGYAMPIFFLLAFASIFRGDTPPLLHQMGQLLTISILGGAALGLPTALVGERERGVWRRYRLLPAPPAALLGGTLLARLVIVATAALLQIACARLIYGTPLPMHPAQAGLAFLFVAFSFLGLGLIVAALAEDVPAVQALGQCIFLPMIMIGGVGVPLSVLPGWAQKVAGFMPGRYAVDVLQRSLSDPAGLEEAHFSLLALGIIGLAAGCVGLKLFRWDSARAVGRRASLWVAGALLSWFAVGGFALATGRLRPVQSAAEAYEAITQADMDKITYEDLPGDNELATRLSPRFGRSGAPSSVAGFSAKLQGWRPSAEIDPVQQARNLLSIAAIADVTADLREAEIARLIFNELKWRRDPAELKQILTWILLHPKEGTVITSAPELGFRRQVGEAVIRERVGLYAKKLLGRLLGRIPD